MVSARKASEVRQGGAGRVGYHRLSLHDVLQLRGPGQTGLL